MISEDILKPLQEIDGYLAAVIFDMDGKVLAQHNQSKHDTEQIVSNVSLIMNATLNAVNEAKFGACQFIQISSGLGILGATWWVEDKIVAAILLKPKGNIGMGKLALIKAAQTIKKEHL